MIHSIHSEFAPLQPENFHASRSSHLTHAFAATRGRTHVPAGGWTFPSFAEPEIDSLWDANLLDRLSAPLTRYHE